MKKLEKLTAEQAAKLRVYRDEYLRIGLSTEPADRVAAEDHIRDAYRVANMEPPKVFIWLLSPMAGAIASAMIVAGKADKKVRAQVGDQVRAQVGAQVRAQVGDQVGAQVGDQVWDQVGAQVWDQVRAQVGAQVGDQVWDQVWAQVGAQVWDQVGAQVRDQVWDQVWAQVGAQVWAQVGAQVWKAGYGSHDANWLAFYTFFAQEAGITDALKLAPLDALARTAGWWWPFEGLCIVTDRPEALRRDEANRLHSEHGMALRYRDGWGIYVWHGYRLPMTHEWIITDKAKITAATIMSEPNAEIRRIMCEITEYKPIRDLATVISEDRDGNGHPRRLLRARVANEEIRILEVENGSLEPDGSRRKFLLGAMPGDTPHEAVANSYGINPAVYREAIRT